MLATWTIHDLENVLTWQQDGKQAKHQLSRTSELGVTSKHTQGLEQLQPSLLAFCHPHNSRTF
jgi:hypothetical protein